MAADRQLVLDANILIRAVLGRRVRQIISNHAEHASFYAPAVAYDGLLPTASRLLITADRGGSNGYPTRL